MVKKAALKTAGISMAGFQPRPKVFDGQTPAPSPASPQQGAAPGPAQGPLAGEVPREPVRPFTGVGSVMAAITREAEAMARVFALFPSIVEHRHRIAGYLSGGQQQMVAIGRALMGEPKLLLLDEPSLGLAPLIIDEIFQAIRRLRDENGLTVLLVEQNAKLALSLADYGYIMESGRIVLDGTPERLLANDDVQQFYLGVHAGGERRSMREIKHYKRRKRWLS